MNFAEVMAIVMNSSMVNTMNVILALMECVNIGVKIILMSELIANILILLVIYGLIKLTYEYFN